MAAPITLSFLSGKCIQMDFNPDEPIWSFSRRVGNQTRSLTDNGNTCLMKLLSCGQQINTFENRLKPIGQIVPDATTRVYAVLNYSEESSHVMKGNASPQGGERTICAVCLDLLKVIRSGSRANPLIPITLDCGHAFHHGCLLQLQQRPGQENRDKCPICRTPIKERVKELSEW